MPRATWEALRPELPEIQSIEFGGGGEPLLQPRLGDWIRDAKSAECTTGVRTNGVLLTRRMSDEVLTAGLDWMVVSSFGARERTEDSREPVDFESVCDNLKTLASLRWSKTPRIVMEFFVTPGNVGQVEGLAKLAEEIGVDQVKFRQRDIVRGRMKGESGVFAPEPL